MGHAEPGAAPGEPRRARTLDWLDSLAASRREAGLRRALTPRPRAAAGAPLDLASNDYLGLSRNPRVIEGAVRSVREWGTGSTGSRLVTGTTAEHAELEDELAGFLGQREPVDEVTGIQAKFADAVRARETGGVKKDAARAVKHHELTSGTRCWNQFQQVEQSVEHSKEHLETSPVHPAFTLSFRAWWAGKRPLTVW